MNRLRQVDVPTIALERLQPLIGEERYGALVEAAQAARSALGGTTIWNVNSTASGGGVAEMLQVLVGYTLGAGLDVRWVVAEGDPQFFAITKRIHNRLHGVEGDDGALGEEEAAHYEEVTATNAAALLDTVRAGDIVLLHDPQTAGLAAALTKAGARVVWRCHIGSEHRNEWTEDGWQFLRPHLDAADMFVFSCAPYVPPWLPEERVVVIPPSIDPFSPKNQELSQEQVRSIISQIGLIPDDGGASETCTFTRRDGTPGTIERRDTVVGDRGPLDPDVPLVVQVSRWDRLKDMAGVMEGFASRVAGRVDAQLALVGPSVEGVADDPEGAAVLQECTAAWEALPRDVRARVRLVSLPMEDVDENAAMVNAIQRHATVIVQKSLAEGFGLTVAEGMWKGKPVVASAVGGVVAQITPGTGVLLSDPRDLAAFGDALADLLEQPDEITRLGDAARRHVLDEFVGDRHLRRYGELVTGLVTRERA